jgi:hypothetical protein
MKFSLKGRLANFDLPPSKAMNPLFEAIVNSIHAIEEKFSDPANQGRISIYVLRNDSQSQMELSERFIQPIDEFTIEDNGIGFDDKNYNSFETSDSTYKLSLGGKGVGRFTWLKAFDEVKIDSVYGIIDKCKRIFDFIDTEGIQNVNVVPVNNETETYSKVILRGYHNNYRKQCPKRLDVIASKIIEHCLSYFVLGTCPDIP